MPKNALSRHIIVNAGLELAHIGTTELTMRRVAQHLNVTPMALYRHFDDKAELISAVLDTFVRQADVLGHNTDEKETVKWLEATFRRMHATLSEAPLSLLYVKDAAIMGPCVLEIQDRTLGVLLKAGLSEALCVKTLAGLSSLAIGAAYVDQTREQNISHILQSADALSQDSDKPPFPFLTAMAEAFSKSNETGFEGELSVMLKGVETIIGARPDTEHEG